MLFLWSWQCVFFISFIPSVTNGFTTTTTTTTTTPFVSLSTGKRNAVGVGGSHATNNRITICGMTSKSQNEDDGQNHDIDDDDVYVDVIRESCDVAIFGGGFGGLYTALAIDREYQRQQQKQGRPGGRRSNKKKLDIALVTPTDNFVFLPLLYDLTMGTASELEVCPPYKSILAGTNIRQIKATLDDLNGPDGYTAQITVAPPKYKTSSMKQQQKQQRRLLDYRTGIVAVGATPQAVLNSIPGAKELTQPYYTKEHAEQTDKLLDQLESMQEPRIAVVGGGYGGVELATCVKRRIPHCHVTLLTRGPPMQGTRAEPLINQALDRMNVNVRVCSVKSVELATTINEEEGPAKIRENLKKGVGEQVIVNTESRDVGGESLNGDDSSSDDEDPFDAVLWTAGSGPAYPVVEALDILNKVGASGRLAIDGTLRCTWNVEQQKQRSGAGSTLLRPPRVWAIGDCAEIFNDDEYATPKTAQAAIQQADVVANNVLVELGMVSGGRTKTFQYQDLGSMLTLGGPNGAVLAPPQNSLLGPLFAPAIDIARVGFGIADGIFGELSKSSETGEKTDLGTTVENLGLSLGGYGLGVDPNVAPGTLAGTMSGLARRSIYALRMPTNRQRIIAATSAGISTAVALAKEASAFNDDEDEKKDKKKKKV